MVNIFRLALLVMCSINFGITYADISKKTWAEFTFKQ